MVKMENPEQTLNEDNLVSIGLHRFTKTSKVTVPKMTKKKLHRSFRPQNSPIVSLDKQGEAVSNNKERLESKLQDTTVKQEVQAPLNQSRYVCTDNAPPVEKLSSQAPRSSTLSLARRPKSSHSLAVVNPTGVGTSPLSQSDAVMAMQMRAFTIQESSPAHSSLASPNFGSTTRKRGISCEFEYHEDFQSHKRIRLHEEKILVQEVRVAEAGVRRAEAKIQLAKEEMRLEELRVSLSTLFGCGIECSVYKNVLTRALNSLRSPKNAIRRESSPKSLRERSERKAEGCPRHAI